MSTTSMTTTEVPAEQAVALVRDGTEAGQTGMAKAQVEARYIMAARFPRDEDVVRQRLLRECSRPGFARAGTPEDPGGALYRLPFGNKPVSGFSIRFAEAAARSFRNIMIESRITYDDAQRRVVSAIVTDLEANIHIEQPGEIEKIVTRRQPPTDRTVLRVRRNSRGETTYVVQADEREVRQLTGAELSKCIRTAVLRFIPGWLLDECRQAIERTIKTEVSEDPDLWRRRIADAFAAIRVPVEALKSYLGHDLAMASAEELAELRGVYTAVKDGEIQWHEVVAAKSGHATAKPTSNGGLAKKLARRRAATSAEVLPTAPPPGAGDAWEPTLP